MKTIQSPDGVALLMENLWLRHKAGMQQRPCNVFMVELPPPTEEDLAKGRSLEKGSDKSASSYVLSDNSIASLIGKVTFDDVAKFYVNSDWEQRHLIVFKDAFDFLRDIHPDAKCKETVEYKNNMVQIGVVETWSEFVAQKAKFCDGSMMSPAEFVSILLRYLTSEGHRSIYNFPIKENYADIDTGLVKKYVSSQRGLRKWLYALFNIFNRNGCNKESMLKREAFLSSVGLSHDILDSLPLEVANLITSNRYKIEIKKVHSHIGECIAIDYIEHLLRKYDKEQYADYAKIVVLYGSDNPKHLLVNEFLREHFETQHVYEIPSSYNGLELTIIQLSDED